MSATAVEKIDIHENNLAVSETGRVLDLIGRAASDPNCDIDKMERLMRMHTDMVMRTAEQDFNQAMRRAQEKMKRIAADSNNTQTHSKYASFAALDRVLRPIYTAEGFALSFDSGEGAPVECVRVVCFVSHDGGFTRKYHVDMPADGKGAKGGDVMTKTHATGSAFTYGQRYLEKLIFNVAIGDDDDGNAASSEPITVDQVHQLQTLITDIGGKKFVALTKGLLKYMKVERVEDIPLSKFKNAKAALEKKRGTL
jgi:hypothetical protein